MDRKLARQQVIRAGKELSESGLIARTWGNVSCRLDEEYFAITASGRNYRTLIEEEVVAVKLSDLSYTGTFRPSSEMKIHKVVYELKKDAGFVIHTHQDHASAVSAMGLGEICFGKAWPYIGETVLCAEYALPGTQELCDNTRKALELSRGRALLLKNHGALCFGADYDEAFQAAYALEEACSAYLKNLELEIFSSGREENRQLGSRVIWNRSPVLLAFAQKGEAMLPYLDDFAQIAGLKVKVLPENRRMAERAVQRGKSVIVQGIGAFCTAGTLDDAQALSAIIEKNAMAFFAAEAGRGNPLKRRDCRKMRRNYIKNYSRLAEDGR